VHKVLELEFELTNNDFNEITVTMKITNKNCHYGNNWDIFIVSDLTVFLFTLTTLGEVNRYRLLIDHVFRNR